MPSTLTLKTRLGLASAILGGTAIVTALVLYFGMTRVAGQLETAVAAETRMNRYGVFSREVSTFIVIAAEAIQSGLTPEARTDRLEPIANQIDETIRVLKFDVEKAVASATDLGLDVQSRYATQSLDLARMEALLASTRRGLEVDGDAIRLRAQLDTFASQFDPLLNQAVNAERIFRNETLGGIEDLRRTLAIVALGMVALAIALVFTMHFGLVRPQFRRLDRLRMAAQRIGAEDLAFALPETRPDEIGTLYAETNRMIGALAARKQEVEAEWSRLNETIAERTAALSDANRQLEKVDENRRRFFADISHELRTPLTVILSEAEIGRAKSPGTAEAFATIEAKAKGLGRRIDDLLRIARSESGQLALNPVDLDLTVVLKEAAADAATMAKAAGLKITFDLDDIMPFNGDPDWLRQVFSGLIDNAIRHGNGGRLHISARMSGEAIDITLIDNGPGIPDGAAEAIFDRFAQSGAESAKGFGIGLSLARWVLDGHGGRIALVSPVPRAEALDGNPGTKVAVRLATASM